MKIIKKIDMYLLKNFLGLFLMTFFICVFILLMQFVWMHIKDLVGKGVEITVLGEFFIHAVFSVVPLALPLAILLSSLMTFGNLGEKFELTAMKSAGISLFRIMRPLAVTIGFISIAAFFFSNNVLPISQVKLWTLIFSLRQKSPEMQIPEGEFYSGITGYNIYVRSKDHKSGLLYDMMIYDYSEGFENAKVMVADSGKVFCTEDKKYLVLQLYSGESFENLDTQGQTAQTRQKIPYRRETFASKRMLIDFDTDFNRYDESVLADQHVSKNVTQLIHSIDSVNVLVADRSSEQGHQIVHTAYFGRERTAEVTIPEEITTDEVQTHNLDSLYATFSIGQKQRALQTAIDKGKAQQDQTEYNAITLDEYSEYVRKHEVELYRKFTLAFACLIFFFIGAPLGAIIRKGGFGAPVVISVVMFIIYYIIDNTGYKMAREALWPAWAGMWLSSFVLLPIGIFLTYKAATDSALFNPEAWSKLWGEMKAKYAPILSPYWHRFLALPPVAWTVRQGRRYVAPFCRRFILPVFRFIGHLLARGWHAVKSVPYKQIVGVAPFLAWVGTWRIFAWLTPWREAAKTRRLRAGGWSENWRATAWLRRRPLRRRFGRRHKTPDSESKEE